MSTPEDARGAGGESGPDRVQILVDLGACLSAWRRAFAQGVRPSEPSLAGLRRLSAELQGRLPAVGFGGIAVHLRELVRRFDASGAVGNVREPLEAVLELSEQARALLTPREQALLARGGSAPEAPRAAGAPGSSAPAPAPPPMVTVGGQQWGHDGSRRAHPGTPPLLSKADSVKPPRLLESGVVHGSNERPLPGFAPPGAGLPGHGHGPPVPPRYHLPLPAPVQSSPSAAPLPAGGDPSAAPFGAVNASPQVKPTHAPNLLVRPMLGLRAFGKGASPAGLAGPAEVDPRRESGERPSSLLGLKRSSSVPVIARLPSSPPPLLNRSPSGLPPLPPPKEPAQRGGSSQPPRSESGSESHDIRELLGGIERPRMQRQSRKPRGRAAAFQQRREEGSGWKVGAIAAAVLALVLGGIATAVVVLTRQPDEAEKSRGGQANGADSAASGSSPSLSAELPRPRLLNEHESFRALIAQVHGRGKESPQLRALVDEQAALAARAVNSQKCEGTSAACEEWAKIREAILGKQGVQRLTRRRPSGSPERLRSRWLAGLRLPEIPVEDDPRVQRHFEFYTENPVGRETFQTMLFRCGAYRDLIESTLIRHGLPKDLLAIVFAESACEPRASSPVGAAGLWQFMPATARAYHLRVQEGVIDERRSPPKATEAAVQFLRNLHEKLSAYGEQGVWDLVLGSYNMGPFAMVARLERVGGEASFWDLVDSDLLPDETANYAPAVQAIALILNNLQRLKFVGVQVRAPQLTSDMEVPAGTRLSLVARAAATSVHQLRSLNLDISGDRTPGIPNYAIQVPREVVFQARDSLKELIARGDDADLCVPLEFDWGRQRFTREMAAACQKRLQARAAQ